MKSTPVLDRQNRRAFLRKMRNANHVINENINYLKSKIHNAESKTGWIGAIDSADTLLETRAWHEQLEAFMMVKELHDNRLRKKDITPEEFDFITN